MRKTSKPRTCARCGVMFERPMSSILRGRRFCSRTCYFAEVATRPAMVDITCALCGGHARRTRAAVNRVKHSFCSFRCAMTFQRGANNGQWRGGSDPNRGRGWVKRAEQIRERDGYRCRRCGKSQEEAGQRLSVDHVIPWRVFDNADEANDPANLVALCRACHASKTRAESKWLRGDVLEMQRYQEAVREPWTASDVAS